MKNITKKIMASLNRLSLSKIKNRKLGQTFVFMTSYLFYQTCFAAEVSKDDKTWGGLYTFLDGLFSGTSAGVISLSALLIGLLFALFTDHKIKAILGGVGIPVAIQVGPAIFIGLSGTLI